MFVAFEVCHDELDSRLALSGGRGGAMASEDVLWWVFWMKKRGSNMWKQMTNDTTLWAVW